jgi:hypothetical protein
MLEGEVLMVIRIVGTKETKEVAEINWGRGFITVDGFGVFFALGGVGVGGSVRRELVIVGIFLLGL